MKVLLDRILCRPEFRIAALLQACQSWRSYLRIGAAIPERILQFLGIGNRILRNTAVLLVCLSTAAHADYAAGSRTASAGDYATAYAEWQPLAATGDAASQTGLGLLYEYGRGVRQDFGQAATWFRRAAEQGNAAAQIDLGLLYASGRGVPLSREEAFSWYQKAADQGLIRAQNFLGTGISKAGSSHRTTLPPKCGFHCRVPVPTRKTLTHVPR